jgi:E3 ubiquitin-protein ligase HUWE1
LKTDARTKPAGAASDDDMSPVEDELEGDGPEDIDDLEDLEGIDDDDDDDDIALDTDEDDDVTDDVEVALDEVADVIEVPGVAGVAVSSLAVKAKPGDGPDGAAETDTDDDELQAEEIEASLDVILAERLRGDVSEIDEPNEDEDDEDDDAPNQLATVIPVRRPEEFLCQSCFLLKPPAQLADADHQLCRDCA